MTNPKVQTPPIICQCLILGKTAMTFEYITVMAPSKIKNSLGLGDHSNFMQKLTSVLPREKCKKGFS
jgi:hypothetical protein